MSIDLGIIGAGGIGTEHAKAATAAGHRVTAVFDVDRRRAEALAAAHDGAAATDELTVLLDDRRVDAVVVATPTDCHVALAVAALEAGRDVLLEKPMGRTAAECSVVLAALTATDRFVQMGFVCRLSATAMIARDLVETGRLGTLYHAKACMRRRRGIPGLGGWFTTRARSGGGVLVDLGPHMIDVALHLVGRPDVVRASGTCWSHFGSPITDYVSDGTMWAGPPRPGGTFDVEDGALAMLRCNGDLAIEIDVAWANDLPDGTLPDGVVLLGDAGACFLDLWGDHVLLGTMKDGQLVEERFPVEDNTFDRAFQREHEVFGRCVETREGPTATAEEGRAVQAVIDALYRSSDEGREVAV